jgi:hypothetical protein
MANLSILNPALEVRAVGFHHSAAGRLKLPITPGIINLVRPPCEGDDSRGQADEDLCPRDESLTEQPVSRRGLQCGRLLDDPVSAG